MVQIIRFITVFRQEWHEEWSRGSNLPSFPEEACPHTPLTVAYLCTQYATLATLPSNCLNQETKLVAVQAPFNLQIKRIQIPGILPAKTSPDMMNMLKCMRLNMDPIPWKDKMLNKRASSSYDSAVEHSGPEAHSNTNTDICGDSMGLKLNQ